MNNLLLPSDIQKILEEIKRPYIVLLIGLPLSGKDTFLKLLNIDHSSIVSRDAIILEQAQNLSYNEAYRQVSSKLVDKLFYKKLRESAENQASVFINITHLTKKKRAKSIFHFKSTHTIVGIQFPQLSLEEFRKRNQNRLQNEAKFIAEKVYLELIDIYEHPTQEEGFDLLCALK